MITAKVPTSTSTTIAITGGMILTMIGPPIECGTVVIADGVISYAGPGIEVPPGAHEVDARGKWVLPGFIEAHAHVGIHEESVGVAGDDTNESSSPNTAGVRALDAINIEDDGFQDALKGGITSVIVKPGSANPLAGLTVALKTWGGRTLDEQLLRADVSLKSGLGENPKSVYGAKGVSPVTRMGTAFAIRQAFLDARFYGLQRDLALEAGTPFQQDLNMEAICKMLKGEILWDVHAHRHDDIATALRLAREFNCRLVLNHGTEAYKLTDQIADLMVPVIVGHTITSRSKQELSGHSMATIAALAAAGIKVALTTDHPEVPINFLVHQASFAVKEGLTRTEALEAITTNPAAMFGLDHRVGSLAAGLDADIVIWSGDPLDIMSRPEQIFIEGIRVFANGCGVQDGLPVPRELLIRPEPGTTDSDPVSPPDAELVNSVRVT